VVLNPHVTIDSASTGHIAPLFAPIAVGFAIGSNIFAGGLFTGACMNPARAFGPILLTGRWHHVHVYTIAPFIGGALASIFQRIVFGKDPYFAN